MKNKEFIKKSIEENIVDHTAVLNNMKAKAAVLEAQRISKRATGFGLKKAAVFAMLAVLCITSAFSSIYLMNDSNDMVAPVTESTMQESSVAQNCAQSASATSCNDTSVANSSTNTSEKHEPKSSDSSSGGFIADLPLNDEEKAFFTSFSDNFTVLQSLINARLDAQTDTADNYVQVTDERFKTISDIKDFLYSFMKPESAGEIYVGLTSGTKPYYKEKDEVLYQKTDVMDNSILEINTDTAFLISRGDNTLIINAMLKTSGGTDYYRRFEFEKINGEWLYVD